MGPFSQKHLDEPTWLLERSVFMAGSFFPELPGNHISVDISMVALFDLGQPRMCSSILYLLQ